MHIQSIHVVLYSNAYKVGLTCEVTILSPVMIVKHQHVGILLGLRYLP